MVFGTGGLPVKSNHNNAINADAITFLLGFKKEDVYSLGFSYDMTISKLNISNTHGSHELSLSYQFCSLKNQRGRRIFVDCPSF